MTKNLFPVNEQKLFVPVNEQKLAPLRVKNTRNSASIEFRNCVNECTKLRERIRERMHKRQI